MSIVNPPVPGAVVADLDTLKFYVGTRTNTDDRVLEERLAVAANWVYRRVYPEARAENDVQEAILLTASRLYKRRQTPEGVAGFGGEGAVVRIVAADPDIVALLELHIDYTKMAGFA
jgi:hypothetical protein